MLFVKVEHMGELPPWPPDCEPGAHIVVPPRFAQRHIGRHIKISFADGDSLQLS